MRALPPARQTARWRHWLPPGQRLVEEHLKVLEQAGIVEVRREGRGSHYRLNRVPVAGYRAGAPRGHRHVLAGIGIFVAGLLGGGAAPLLLALAVAGGVPVVYSYVLYRRIEGF